MYVGGNEAGEWPNVDEDSHLRLSNRRKRVSDCESSQQRRRNDLVDAAYDAVDDFAPKRTVDDGGVGNGKLCSALDNLAALRRGEVEDGDDVAESSGAGTLDGGVQEFDQILPQRRREVGRMERQRLRECFLQCRSIPSASSQRRRSPTRETAPFRGKGGKRARTDNKEHGLAP